MVQDDVRIGLKLDEPDGRSWRIISVSGMTVRMIEMNITKRVFKTCNLQNLTACISSGQICVSKDQEITVVDKAKLPKEIYEDFLRKKSFVEDFNNIFGPTFAELEHRARNTSALKLLMEKYGFGCTLSYRIIRQWLQSGMQESSLVDQRSLGRRRTLKKPNKKQGRKSEYQQGLVLDDDLRGIFEEALCYYKKNRVASVCDAYTFMLLNHFSVSDSEGIEVLPDSEIPTLRQLRYYFSTHMSHEEALVKKTSSSEYRNANRLLLSTPRDADMRPGWIVEVDAVEVDLQIVSSLTENQNIGKPIVYMMIDIYSHAIVAFSVGYENNSNLGLSDLMLNLFDDKVQLLNAYGIKNFKGLIPSRFIPHEIRCDRGSDFKSDYFLRVCEELNVKRSLVTGATGSMKGSVEQSFHQFQKTIRPALLDKGIVQPRYDSKHYEEAVLILEDTFRLVVSFIAYYNSRHMPNVQIPAVMVKKGYTAKPVDIWNYGVSVSGVPTPVNEGNYAQILYSLMTEDKAFISRSGISYKGLVYSSSDSDILERMRRSPINANKVDKSGRRRNEITIRTDPRSINNLYYLKDGHIQSLELIPSVNKVRDMTFSQYFCYQKALKEQNHHGMRNNRENSVKLAAEINRIAEDAVERNNGLKPVRTGIAKARKKETFSKNFENRISSRLEDEPVEIEVAGMEVPFLKQIPEKEKKKITEEKANPMPDSLPEELWDIFD